MSEYGEQLEREQIAFNERMHKHQARFERARIDAELMRPERAPGDIPLLSWQKHSTNWFWQAVRDGNQHARELALMTPAERKRDLLKLGMGRKP